MARKVEKKYRGVYERDPGSSVWWIRYADQDGKERREKVGKKSDAIALYQQRKSEVRAGAKLPANMRFRGERVSDVIDRAIFWYRSHSKPRTAITSITHLKAAKKALGHKLVEDLTAHDIDAWLSEHPTWSPGTRNRHKSSLSRALQLALVSGHVKQNVARLVSPRRETKKRVRYLLPDEEARLRKVIRKPEQLAEFEIALHTGMRRGEQFSLTWNDVDFKRRVVYVKAAKTDRDREVPMSDTCYRVLQELNKKKWDNWVFQSSRFKKRIIDNRKWWETALTKARVENFRWHDLRHTFASRLVQRGIDLYVVSRLMGHGNVATTQIYAHLAPDNLVDAIRVLG